MPKRKSQIQHAQIVRRFAEKLRELRLSRGMTQADLGQAAQVTGSYVGRLEAGATSPGIDLLERLSIALGTSPHELLPMPSVNSGESLMLLQSRAKKLFETLLDSADRETLLMLVPLLARLAESPTRKR
ncbi:MAG: hypothetical protein RL240_247 [Planctomycetota bacterium]|jgi:transcriptional regulator with XRE-family HTH domain